MLLWIGLALMTVAVVVAVTRPLLRTSPKDNSTASPDASAIYRDQIEEIDREVARGVLDPTEAEAARTEVARRLLAADAERAHVGAPLPGQMGSTGTPAAPVGPAIGAAHSAAGIQPIAFALMACVPLAALGIYLWTGSPGLPGQPLSARLAQPTTTADVDELIRKVEERLRAHPEDGQGWDVIAPVYFKQSRYREAADAFQRASRILGETPRRLAGFAEATVIVNDGIVTEPARIAYEKLTKLEPDRVEPKFWLALAKEQDGKLDAAIADYETMLATAPPDASWRPMVVERLEETRSKLGKPPTQVQSPPSPSSSAPPVTTLGKDAPRGPSADDIANASKLPAADRQAMIEGMVDGLANRLKANGRDLAGWDRLIRAYAIMGRKADAVAALGDARRNFKDEPQPLAQLSELAKSLGLES